MPSKKLTLTIETKVSIRGAGEFIIGVKFDGDQFIKNWGKYSDTEIKELLLQDIESAVCAKLKATPLKGELVKAVARLRRHQPK
jgi:hypothetical protein